MMSPTNDDQAASWSGCTTNAHDLAEAARLQAGLKNSSASSSCSRKVGNIATVSIDEGAHKYVLVRASTPGSSDVSSRVKTFVYSKQGASYHRNVAEYLLPILQGAGYYDIRITGGGRILRDSDNKQINIFGYSYGFGQADHKHAAEIVKECGLFDGFSVKWSNEGY